MRRRWVLATLLSILFFVTFGRAQEEGRIDTLRIVSPGEKGEGLAVRMGKFHYVGSPMFSRDGQWIAFDGYQGKEDFWSECWVVRSDGTDQRKLVEGATPRWSPDGKQLLFMREKRGGQKGPHGIFVVQSDGTGERRIGDGRWPDWSPDGKKFVFSIGGRGTTGGSLPFARVCIANLDGTEQEEIAFGDCPSWSPDGKKIACCYRDPAIPGPLLRVVDLETKQQTLIGVGWFRANWSADSANLYAAAYFDTERTGMAKFSLQPGSKPEPFLPRSVGLAPNPSWDGKRVVYCTPSDTH
jgi:hypothetical protein